MDAVKFIEERNRMCGTMSEMWGVDAAQIVKNTEEWVAAHPRKTRQSVFLEQYPNARIDSQAVIYVCPADAYGDKVCPKNGENVRMLCRDCRREFWPQKVE